MIRCRVTITLCPPQIMQTLPQICGVPKPTWTQYNFTKYETVHPHSKLKEVSVKKNSNEGFFFRITFFLITLLLSRQLTFIDCCFQSKIHDHQKNRTCSVNDVIKENKIKERCQKWDSNPRRENPTAT